MQHVIPEILAGFDTISLKEMKAVRLMNRTDTKYVTTRVLLQKMLEAAKADYFVQEIEGERLMPYYTLYFDTPDCRMYMEHLHGKLCRQKIRVRRYEESGTAFLEVKRKNNKGRTNKKRTQCCSLEPREYSEFIADNSAYDSANLQPQIENRFFRITLVNRDLTERLTIDTQLRFHSLRSGNVVRLDDFAVIELKRDGRTASPALEILRKLRIHPSGFSKYCMGMALTDAMLPHNRFKQRLRLLGKLSAITSDTVESFG